ncbi:hypothetical protein AMELA_G00166210 [Ameiurus melas]|uniref:Uncharacterized protein n=1 Tax=Ameiurus melas TaxID=219545 RepID=A0A7J6AB90_AMEME|nr:hypothetical protein AMELA_G00166210 [Ameiurus melas]
MTLKRTGGGNTPSCLPTAIKEQQEEEATVLGETLNRPANRTPVKTQCGRNIHTDCSSNYRSLFALYHSLP